MRHQRVSTRRVTPELFALAANRYITVSSLLVLEVPDLPIEQTISLAAEVGLQHSRRSEVGR